MVLCADNQVFMLVCVSFGMEFEFLTLKTKCKIPKKPII